MHQGLTQPAHGDEKTGPPREGLLAPAIGITVMHIYCMTYTLYVHATWITAIDIYLYRCVPFQQVSCRMCIVKTQ